MIHTLETVIREHPFFHDFPEEHLSFITGCAKNVQFPEKHFIFLEGDPADEFYFIREGMVSVEMVIPHLGATTVQTLGEGEILGWSWVSPPYAGILMQDTEAHARAGLRRKVPPRQVRGRP